MFNFVFEINVFRYYVLVAYKKDLLKYISSDRKFQKNTMIYNNFIFGFILLISCASITIVKGESKENSLKQPNVLLVIADDASRNSFGAYGCTYTKTPAFDELAKEGVMFTNAYTCNPKCAPSRASVLTGRYSWQLEETCNHNPYVSDKWQFYPYILEENGYEVAGTGKGYGPGVWKGKGCYSNYDNPAGYLDNKLKLVPPYDKIKNIDYASNFNEFLTKRDAEKPFCFWLGTFEPHRAYEKDSWKKAGKDLSKVTVPKCFPDNETVRGDLADYSLEVEWFDLHLGKAVQSLKKAGLFDNTIIIVTSDHGMPFPHSKGQLYNEAFHMPFLVCWRNKVKGGRKISDFVNFPDIAPTILDLLGLEQHPQFTGESFKKQLLSNKTGRIDKKRNFTVSGKERHDIGRSDPKTGMLSVGYPVRVIRTDKYLYLRNFKPERWPVGDPVYGFKNCDLGPTRTYILDHKDVDAYKKYYAYSFDFRPAEELYDMEKDVDCINNLANNAEYADIVKELRAKLEKTLIAQQDPRILGEGDVFDYYPNRHIESQRELYNDPHYNPDKIYEEFLNRK